jgi:hypothetical protein
LRTFWAIGGFRRTAQCRIGAPGTAAIQPALLAWLTPNRGQKTGKVCPPICESFWQRAGITAWPINALRHSFASYALEHFKQPGTLTVEMGLTDEDLVSKFDR